ncbi:hypothetical protein KFU94_48465 [Chloroflexi bacterium TSY]|nr:hypothetical protein [Chloroflexi bacterium TSY]
MNYKTRIHLSQILPLAVVLLLLAAVAVNGTESTRPIPASAIKEQQQTTDIDTLGGTYAGVVIVSDPAALGSLDLVLDITSGENNTLSGSVNAARTQVFLGGPTIAGTISASDDITPTVQIESEIFDSVVSGREVQRQFTLTGDILDKGNKLQGEYTETITGFTPKPLHVTGTFLVLRPGGSIAVIENPDTPTATPTRQSDPAAATPTHTPTLTPTQPGQTDQPTETPTRPAQGDPATPTPTSTRPTNADPTNGNNVTFLPLLANRVQSVRGAAIRVVESAITPTPADPGATATRPPISVYLPIFVKE